ncbi:MAG: hypothetical protein FWC40_03770 [Proteobacteria bacterium]|nr:hypothetical protein [Pseudomonadota bacterium]
MIIALSGIDAAGKSTHIQWLRRYFISQGKTCAVLWYRPGYSHELQALKDAVRPLWRLCQGVCERIGQKLKTSGCLAGGGRPSEQAEAASSGEAHAKPAAERAPARLWLAVALLDATWQWGVKLRCLARRYDVVICDRYIEDARLDLLFRCPDDTWSDGVLNRMASWLPKPDVALLLWLPYETMNARIEAKDEPFPDDVHTRQLRYRAYEMIDSQGGCVRIDASGTIEQTHQAILEAIGVAG